MKKLRFVFESAKLFLVLIPFRFKVAVLSFKCFHLRLKNLYVQIQTLYFRFRIDLFNIRHGIPLE